MRQRIRLEGNAAVVSYADFKQRPIALHLTGIPTIPRPIAGITEFLLDLGFHVLQPQYPGTFDSAGEFLPHNASDIVFTWSQLLESGSLPLSSHATLPVEPKLGLLSSHSFGTYVAIDALLRGARSHYALFFAPMFEFGRKASEVGLRIDLQEHSRQFPESLPLTFRTPTTRTVEEFFVGSSVFIPSPEEAVRPKVPARSIAVLGLDDPSLDSRRNVKYLRGFATEYSDSLRIETIFLVEGGKHDVESLLPGAVRTAIESMLLEVTDNVLDAAVQIVRIQGAKNPHSDSGQVRRAREYENLFEQFNLYASIQVEADTIYYQRTSVITVVQGLLLIAYQAKESLVLVDQVIAAVGFVLALLWIFFEQRNLIFFQGRASVIRDVEEALLARASAVGTAFVPFWLRVPEWVRQRAKWYQKASAQAILRFWVPFLFVLVWLCLFLVAATS